MYVTSIARKPEEEIEGRLEASSQGQPQVSTWKLAQTSRELLRDTRKGHKEGQEDQGKVKL